MSVQLSRRRSIFITLWWPSNVLTCSDSFTLRPEWPVTFEEWTSLETKTEAFCAGQRKNICWAEDTERRGGGGINSLVSIIQSFSHLCWEVPAGNMQKATVHHIITTQILLISSINAPAASLAQWEKLFKKKKTDKYNMKGEFLWYECCRVSYHITTGATGHSQSFIFKLNSSLNKWSERIAHHSACWEN